MQAKQTERNERTVWKVFTVRNCFYGPYGSCTDRNSAGVLDICEFNVEYTRQEMNISNLYPD